ncbi:MAG: 50S ribosomal protein L24 [Clostridia bacterium]|nr:50S ribosomal protein L24 [Clostridia bacterium]
MALGIKKGDNVLVLAGKDKGKTGKVLSVNPTKNSVVVDGVNVVTKHVKPRSAQQTGGITKENGNIDISNVQLVCPVCGKATRIASGEVDGKKVRICKKCNANMDAKVAKAEKKIRKSTKKAETAVETAVEEKPVKKTRKSTKKVDESASN